MLRVGLMTCYRTQCSEYLTIYGDDTVGNFATQKSWQEVPTNKI